MVPVPLHHCSASCSQAKQQQLGVSFILKVKDLATIGGLYLCKCSVYGDLLPKTILMDSSAMCWGLIMQMGAFAVFLPLYLIVHLSTSPTVLSRRAEDYVVDVPKLFSIPISLVVGYALPAVLLSLPAPSILTYDQKQTFLALWQAFPIWFEVLQQVFSFVFAKVRDRTSVSPASLQNPVRRTIETMRSVYMFVLAIAGVTRITTIMLSMTSKLFPAVFSQEFRGVLDPSNVFQDRSFFASDKMDSIGAGAFQFLQYDEIFGSVALIFWSLTLYLNMYLSTTTFDSWKALKVFSAFTVSTALFGPCGCAVCFIWARDELVFAAKEKYGKKSS